jgi:hypothetical protein
MGVHGGLLVEGTAEVDFSGLAEAELRAELT